MSNDLHPIVTRPNRMGPGCDQDVVQGTSFQSLSELEIESRWWSTCSACIFPNFNSQDLKEPKEIPVTLPCRQLREPRCSFRRGPFYRGLLQIFLSEFFFHLDWHSLKLSLLFIWVRVSLHSPGCLELAVWIRLVLNSQRWVSLRLGLTACTMAPAEAWRFQGPVSV